jgi:hypothetical protein
MSTRVERRAERRFASGKRSAMIALALGSLVLGFVRRAARRCAGP